MNILILGVTGLIGHSLATILAKNHEVIGTKRSKKIFRRTKSILNEVKIVDLDDFHGNDLNAIFNENKIEMVINCIGAIKPSQNRISKEDVLFANKEIPHLVHEKVKERRIRMIHLSTDCVFDGKSAPYDENSETSLADDCYSSTKISGEITDSPYCLTLRTSFIGRELFYKGNLMEWFLKEAHKSESVSGFRNVIFSGLPTYFLAQVIEDYVLPNSLSGLYHVSSKPISKFDLLVLIAKKLNLSIDVVPIDEPVLDMTLTSKKFEKATGFQTPDWNEMTTALDKFYAEYDEFHEVNNV